MLAVVSSADFAPPQQAFQVFGQLSERIDVKTGLLQAVVDEDVPRFVNLVHELEIPTITSNPIQGLRQAPRMAVSTSCPLSPQPPRMGWDEGGAMTSPAEVGKTPET